MEELLLADIRSYFTALTAPGTPTRHRLRDMLVIALCPFTSSATTASPGGQNLGARNKSIKDAHNAFEAVDCGQLIEVLGHRGVAAHHLANIEGEGILHLGYAGYQGRWQGVQGHRREQTAGWAR
jgi:hypothetical protein